MSVTRGRFTGRGVEVSLDPQRVVCGRGVMFQQGLCSVDDDDVAITRTDQHTSFFNM